MSLEAFHQPGRYDSHPGEGSLFPLREEMAATQGQNETEDRENPREKKDWCGCYVDHNKSKELLSEYLESASIHGIAQTSGPQFYSWRRPVWLLLIIAMAVALTVTLYQQITSLYHYPIRTVTKMTINDELPFPAVTICNLNQYIRHRLPDNPMLERVLFAQSQYAGLSGKLAAVHNTSDLDDLTDVPGDELRRIVLHAAPRLEEILYRCSWGFKVYNCQDLFRPLDTGFGRCYVFNGPDIESDKLANATSTFSQLRVTVNIQSGQSYYSKVIHAGIKVLVHQQDQMPFPLYEGWFVRPGVAAAMALTKSSGKCLPSPYKAYSNGYCEDTKEEGYKNRLKRYKIYTAENCMNDCLFEKLEDHCGCRHYFANGNHSFCSAKQILTCYMPAYGLVDVNDAEKCDCPRECDTTTYEADMRYANYATQFISEQAVKDGVIMFNNTLRKNIIDLRVFYRSMNVMEVIQEPEMSASTVIGSLGGQLGLFLGASALSFVELIEILSLVFISWIKKGAHKALDRCIKGPFSA